MASRMRCDALNSPGYNPEKLLGERLEKMMRLAERAANSFPPPFQEVPYDGPLETPVGDRCLMRGCWAFANRQPAPKDSGMTGKLGPGWPTTAELDEELGGPDGFFTLCGIHYCNLFANPRMWVLFDTREADSAACAMDHGKRIASALLDGWHGSSYFGSLGRGFSGASFAPRTHNRAKNCPMRPLHQQVPMPAGHALANRRFTTAQRNTWVGSHMCAAEECGASQEFQEKYGLWLAMTTSAYGPFLDEDTGKLDWMEESSYGL